LIVLAINLIFFRKTSWFIPLLVVTLTVGWLPFWINVLLKLTHQREIESKFPEFVRNLVGSVRSGMPAPKAILHVSTIDYGALSPYITKLAHQIEWAIPVHKALTTFANETKNIVIKRAVASVIEAETSGGNIEDVLEAITSSVVEIKKIKDKRRAAGHSQIIHSYVLFMVFLVVMIVIQNMLIPYMMNLEQAQATEGIVRTGFSGMTKTIHIDFTSVPAFAASIVGWFGSLHGVLIMLASIQGLFAGLVIGKMSEGVMMQGIKHSLILITIAIFILSLTQAML
jgi:flagellar protein FlaJ